MNAIAYQSQKVSLFKAILSGDFTHLQQLGLQFHKDKKTWALLCLDHCFTQIPSMETLRASDLFKILEAFSVYAWLLHDVILVDPGRSQSIQQLFNIQVSVDNIFSITVGTFLHQGLQEHRAGVLQENEKTVSVSGLELQTIFTESLRKRLRLRVEEQNYHCRQAKALSPCLVYSVYGICRRGDCGRDHAATDPKSFNLRVTLHLQQISIYQTLHGIQWPPELLKQRSYVKLLSGGAISLTIHCLNSHWIDRLYDTLNPPYHHLGSRAILDLTGFEHTAKVLRIVGEWVRSILYDLRPTYAPDKFLTLFMKAADFYFSLPSVGSATYMSYLPCMARIHTPDNYLRGAVARSVVKDLLDALENSHPACLPYGVLFLE